MEATTTPPPPGTYTFDVQVMAAARVTVTADGSVFVAVDGDFVCMASSSHDPDTVLDSTDDWPDELTAAHDVLEQAARDSRIVWGILTA